MRKIVLACAAAAAAAVFAGGALPVSAVDTTTTFTVNGGSLDLAAPGAADLGSAEPGALLTGALGTVTVTDARSLRTGFWTATVITSDFTTGAATAAETIAATQASYESGPATATTGQATFTPASAAAFTGFASPETAFTVGDATGSNSASWAPTIAVAFPAGAIAGSYTGTITHSVA